MDLKNYTFLIILSLIFIAPLIFSFTGKSGFLQKLRYAMPAIFISGFMFLLWDIRFTQVGIWSYREEYTVGLFHKGLPIEEWFFYLVIPYSALFVYEIIKTRFSTLNFNNISTAISLALIVCLGIVAYMYRIRLYTFFCFFFTTIYLGYTIFRKQFKPHLTHFFLSYIIMLVPYLLLNGILTWNMAIEYHQEQVLNIWLWMVPVENLVYLFLLMLINITVYEYLSERNFF